MQRVLQAFCAIILWFALGATYPPTGPIEQAFDRGYKQAKNTCVAQLQERDRQHQIEESRAVEAAYKRCATEFAPLTRPGFGSPPESAYIFVVIASYISFAALKIVSITAIFAIGKKISKEQRISAVLFASATIVIFIIFYAMSGLKPLLDYYLSYGDRGTPLAGIMIYGLPTYVLTFFSFQFIWKRIVDSKKHLPYIEISIFITIVNLFSFLSVDHVMDKDLEIIYPIHLIYLSILLAMLIFFGLKYKNGFLKSVDERTAPE